MAEGNQIDQQNSPQTDPALEVPPIREDLVNTAAKFLRNPKVLSSSLDQKKAFMKKKGLTDYEISRAIQLSGVSSNTIIAPYESTPPLASQPVSTWSRIRDYSSLTIIIAGVVYGLYTLYKRFIEPLLLRRKAEQDEKLNRMENGIAKLNNDVTKHLEELHTAMNNLKSQLTDQSQKLATVSLNLEEYKDSVPGGESNNNFGALQSEITSIKALLLGRRQFPSTPTIPPVIPSWQMKSKKSDKTPVDDATGSEKNEASELVTNDNVIKTVSKADLEQGSGDEDGLDATSSSEHSFSPEVSSSLSSKIPAVNGHAGIRSPLDPNRSLIGSPSNLSETSGNDLSSSAQVARTEVESDVD